MGHETSGTILIIYETQYQLLGNVYKKNSYTAEITRFGGR